MSPEATNPARPVCMAISSECRWHHYACIAKEIQQFLRGSHEFDIFGLQLGTTCAAGMAKRAQGCCGVERDEPRRAGSRLRGGHCTPDSRCDAGEVDKTSGEGSTRFA